MRKAHWWQEPQFTGFTPREIFQVFMTVMFYTYVLRSKKDGKLYVGSTKNLKERFEQHCAGKVISTSYRRPLALIYYEACVKEEDARRREKTLKSFRGTMFLRRRLKSYFTG